MTPQHQISPELFSFLLRTDTCTVSNAIETFGVRMRNEGYVHGRVHCMTPKLPPVAGYAVTGRIRTSTPPISGLCYYQRPDFWDYIASVPGPKILVIEDVDRIPGVGALFGEIHAEISRALGCTGFVTNGTVRDLRAVDVLGFQCFASGSCVSHAYAHLTEFGNPIEIGGLQISTGDLLHGDCNGVHSVPLTVLERLPAVVAEIAEREAELISLCRDSHFSLRKLEDALSKSRKWSPPTEGR